MECIDFKVSAQGLYKNGKYKNLEIKYNLNWQNLVVIV